MSSSARRYVAARTSPTSLVPSSEAAPVAFLPCAPCCCCKQMFTSPIHSYSSADKSEMALTGLKSRCRRSCLPWRRLGLFPAFSSWERPPAFLLSAPSLLRPTAPPRRLTLELGALPPLRPFLATTWGPPGCSGVVLAPQPS